MAGRPLEFTVAEIAAITGITPNAIRLLIRRRRITRTRRGLIDAAELLGYLAKRGTHGQHTASRIRHQYLAARDVAPRSHPVTHSRPERSARDQQHAGGDP